jgi:hypothetical protein
MANWKAPPSDPGKMWLNRSLELCVILTCDWRCASCNAYSQFPTIGFIRKGMMSLAQIRFFIGEMQQHNAYFGRIRILGGEPCLWPFLEEGVKLLHEGLVVTGHVGRLELITNGDHMDRARAVKPWIEKVRVSDEGDKQRNHIASMAATPLTMGYEGHVCSQPGFCGIQLSALGYFPCSPGSGIAKLRDMKQYQRLTLPTCKKPRNVVSETWPDLVRLCDHCAHALKPEHKVRSGTGVQPGQHALSAPHPEVWNQLAPHLAGKQLDWPIYGQTKQPAVAGTAAEAQTEAGIAATAAV